MTGLILKPASASPPSGEWNDDDYDVLADGVVVGPHLQRCGLASRYAMDVDASFHEDRTPTHGYEATREAAMAAFAKTWRRHNV
jgi:hypothetical protein